MITKSFKLFMRRVIILLVVITASNISYSQINEQENTAKDKSGRNVLLVEALGHGYLYSLNYERVLFGKRKLQTSAQIGVSYYGKKSGIVPLWVPISLNQSIEIVKGKYLEVGVGKMIRNDGYETEEGEFMDEYQIEEWIFRLGYKHYFNNDKWVVKIAYTPIYQDRAEYIHWGGIAFGYRF